MKKCKTISIFIILLFAVSTASAQTKADTISYETHRIIKAHFGNLSNQYQNKRAFWRHNVIDDETTGQTLVDLDNLSLYVEIKDISKEEAEWFCKEAGSSPKVSLDAKQLNGKEYKFRLYKKTACRRSRNYNITCLYTYSTPVFNEDFSKAVVIITSDVGYASTGYVCLFRKINDVWVKSIDNLLWI